jgi:hypothetical protein
MLFGFSVTLVLLFGRLVVLNVFVGVFCNASALGYQTLPAVLIAATFVATTVFAVVLTRRLLGERRFPRSIPLLSALLVACAPAATLLCLLEEVGDGGSGLTAVNLLGRHLSFLAVAFLFVRVAPLALRLNELKLAGRSNRPDPSHSCIPEPSAGRSVQTVPQDSVR